MLYIRYPLVQIDYLNIAIVSLKVYEMSLCHLGKPANVDTIYRMVNHIFEPWYIIQMKSSAANYSFRVNASLGHAGAVKEDIKYVFH